MSTTTGSGNAPSPAPFPARPAPSRTRSRLVAHTMLGLMIVLSGAGILWGARVLSRQAQVGGTGGTPLWSTREVVLSVQGMECVGCVEDVRSELAAVPGVAKVDVSLEAGTAVVLVKAGSPTTPDDLIKAVNANPTHSASLRTTAPASPVAPAGTPAAR
ncbi:MAG: heavy-metal-associated domain-containing protein [bacterium]